jgi:hypothetical protein
MLISPTTYLLHNKPRMVLLSRGGSGDEAYAFGRGDDDCGERGNADGKGGHGNAGEGGVEVCVGAGCYEGIVREWVVVGSVGCIWVGECDKGTIGLYNGGVFGIGRYHGNWEHHGQIEEPVILNNDASIIKIHGQGIICNLFQSRHIIN